jgi:hypothetical protein
MGCRAKWFPSGFGLSFIFHRYFYLGRSLLERMTLGFDHPRQVVPGFHEGLCALDLEAGVYLAWN